MIPGLVEWYQSTCSLDHAEGVSHYATCFSATTLLDERRLSVVNDQATAIFDVEFDVQLVLADFKLKEFLILFSLDTPKIDLIQCI